MTVAIVYGGTSSEAAASAKNAGSIEKVLRARGYDVRMLEFGRDMIRTLRREKADIVYVCVQGKHHGDGTLQAMLEHVGIPFTGSGARAAALINDKILCKLLFDHEGIPTPRWAMLTREQYERGAFDYESFGWPFVAKAPTQGGSFGIELIRSAADLEKIGPIFGYDDPILLEQFVDGDFYTVGLFERRGELVTLRCVEGVETLAGAQVERKNSLTLFTGEYATRPPCLDGETLRRMERTAEQVFKITGARGVGRVDFMVCRDTGEFYVLEINAVPGLKRESLMPREAEYSGVCYEDMVEDILLSAWNGVGEENDV